MGRYGDAWKVRVASAPEKGRANDELVRVLAGVLGLGRSAIDVVGGHGSRDKVVQVTGLDEAAVDVLLDAAATTD